MYMLWIFGDNVSDVFADHGRYKGEALFALFFFVTVIIGGLGHVAATFSNPITRFVPLVGASGGISAVMAAYWRLFPNTMFYQVFFFWPFKISVRFYMLFWMGVQFFLIYKYGTFSNVSWSCHLAGFLGGYFLLPLFLPFSLKEITSKAD
jgi:membrane associated rhomboid family serine protease